MPQLSPGPRQLPLFFPWCFFGSSRPFHPTIVQHLRSRLFSHLAVFCIYRGISQRQSGRARQRAGGRPTGDRDRDTCADAHDGDGRAEARLDGDDRASQEGGLVRSGLREGRLRDWLHCGPQTARDEEHSCGKPHTHSHIPWRPSVPTGPGWSAFSAHPASPERDVSRRCVRVAGRRDSWGLGGRVGGVREGKARRRPGGTAGAPTPPCSLFRTRWGGLSDGF